MVIVGGSIKEHAMAERPEAESCRDEQGQDANRSVDHAGASRPPTCGRKSDLIVWLQLQNYQRNLYKVKPCLIAASK